MCLQAAAAAQPVAPVDAPPAATSVVRSEEPLNLRQAIERALETHIKTRVNKEKIRESEARAAQAWAEINPTVTFNANQYNRTINLASQGLSGSNLPIPAFVGPFYTFDARVQVLYNFLDSAKRWRIKAAEVGKLVSEQELELARQQVDLLTATAYVNLLSARHARQAGLADLALTNKNLELARHQKQQGVAAGIDVTRADAQRVEQELRQASLDDKVRRANLELARLMGTPLATQYLPDESDLPPVEQGMTNESATQEGLANRIELKVARLREEQLDKEISAADAEDSPKMGIVADYGFAGNTPAQNVFGTHNVGLTLQVPIFDGGVSDAKMDVLKSQLEQSKLQRQDQEIQVEQDVRSSFLKLQLARQQIVTARASLVLAQKEMTMATDRFAAGLGTSVELVDAQAKLARARDAEVQALVAYQLAQVELAASIGKPELIIGGNKS
ncbi:MAG: TolC family protein [Candidatus Eremiobacteraeota bacterium]|nr:TolC family protein [Candidatus Eremiobacteraeota bacterium]